MSQPFVIPASVRDHIASIGQPGLEWLAGLDDLIAACASRWSLELGYVVERPGGGLVIRARRDDKPVVLKIWPPYPDRCARETAVLQVATGRGYCHLLDGEIIDEGGVLLLEALGAELDEAVITAAEGPDAVRRIYVASLQAAWAVPMAAVPEIEPGRTLADALGGVIAELAACADIPDADRVVKRALAYAEQRAAADLPERRVLLHGNVAPVNLRQVLRPRQGAPAGYAFVEPRGLRGPQEFDLGSIMAENNKPLLGADDAVLLTREECARYAELAEADAEAVWQWSYVLRVARGLELMAGPTPLSGRGHLQAARALVVRRRA